jgi:hypothetical protein
MEGVNVADGISGLIGMVFESPKSAPSAAAPSDCPIYDGIALKIRVLRIRGGIPERSNPEKRDQDKGWLIPLP